MKRLRTVLFAFAVAALAGSFAAPAYAQVGRVGGPPPPAPTPPGVVFLSTSLPRQMRIDGLTETAGEVVLTAQGGGGNIVDGSSVDLVYSADITNAPASGALTSALTCAPAVAPPPAASCGPSVTATLVGTNIVRVAFANPGDAFNASSFAPGTTLSVSLLRVNANQAGAAGVTATMSGSSAFPASNPITFTDPVRVVGIPLAELVAAATLISPNQLTCAPTFLAAGAAPGGANFAITATEVYPAAIATAAQEAGFSPAVHPATAPGNGTNIQVTITGVPTGFRVAPVFAIQTTATGAAIVGAPTLTFAFGGAALGTTTTGITQGASSGAPITFTFVPTGSSLSAVESFTAGFVIGSTGGAVIPSGGLVGPVTATVSMGPIGGASTVRFAPNGLGPFTIGSVADCVTRLLMTWAANVAGFDTGWAIANTSEDDAAFGTGGTTATPQSGTCVLTGYPSAGGTPISFTTPVIPAGQTSAMVMSSTAGFAGFTGYILTVCNFLNAHAFVFLVDGFGAAAPRVAEGYVANIVPVFGGGRTGGGGGEVLGH